MAEVVAEVVFFERPVVVRSISVAESPGRKSMKTRILLALGALVSILATMPALAEQPALSEEMAFAIATEAYIYGYPLVTMEMTRRVMTNVDTPRDSHSPMGQFYLSREYPTGPATAARR
jgi:hypothetical protein